MKKFERVFKAPTQSQVKLIIEGLEELHLPWTEISFDSFSEVLYEFLEDNNIMVTNIKLELETENAEEE